ncbi:AzlD family protein [Benzoatithermus flavus]|uniref:AzlD domain-containing protein n=1 Tax=Benzoatithermus flavus TaxID=3108223 RepID=A0ABU8Y0A6_9PROT
MSWTSFLAILAMGAVTYATRAGGFWLARRLEPGPFLRAWLEHLPGAVFAALVAPMVAGAGPVGWLAAGAGFLAMRRTGQFLLAIVTGLAVYLLGQELGLPKG